MTREEAIKWLKYVRDDSNMSFNDDSDDTLHIRIKAYTDIKHALTLAISALMREQQFMYNASQGTTTILKIGNRHFEVRERMI